jgi:hypothetical protein
MTTFGDPVFQMGGVPVGVGNEMVTGSVFFVDSTTGNAGNGGKKPTDPMATIDQAINKCTANKGDKIYVMPNHAETILNATTLVPDVAGISIIGLGNGSNQPEITFGHANASIVPSADNITFKNLRFIAGITAVLIGINVDGHYFTMENCTTDFSTTAFDFVDHVDVSAYDYCTIKNCRFIAENATAGSNTGIQFVDANHIKIINNYFSGDFAEAAIWNITTAGVSILIQNNVIYNDDTANADNCISLQAACTGVIAGNYCGSLYATNVTTLIDPGSCLNFNNFFCNAINEHAMILNPGSIST